MAGFLSWKHLRALAVAAALSAGPAFAGGISWGNVLGSTAVDSEVSPLNESWTFYLGYFATGYTPTASNSSSWSTEWTTLDVSVYSASMLFGGVWDNDGLSTGRKGYIWGVNRSLPSNEWVLFTANSWVVPFNNPLNPDSNWFTSGAETVVVGAIVGSELQTAVVSGEPPVLSGENWLALQFDIFQRADPLVSGWSADPDADGLSNLEEFAFGTNPQESDEACIEGEVTGGFFNFTLQKARAVEVVFFGQISNDLLSWNEGASLVALQAETPHSLTYRDLTPILNSNGKSFGRVRVELAP